MMKDSDSSSRYSCGGLSCEVPGLFKRASVSFISSIVTTRDALDGRDSSVHCTR